MLSSLCQEFAEKRSILLDKGDVVTGFRGMIGIFSCTIQDTEIFSVEKVFRGTQLESQCYTEREYNAGHAKYTTTFSVMILYGCIQDYLALLRKAKTTFAANIHNCFESFKEEEYPPETRIKGIFDASSPEEITDVLDCFYPV